MRKLFRRSGKTFNMDFAFPPSQDSRLPRARWVRVRASLKETKSWHKSGQTRRSGSSPKVVYAPFIARKHALLQARTQSSASLAERMANSIPRASQGKKLRAKTWPKPRFQRSSPTKEKI